MGTLHHSRRLIKHNKRDVVEAGALIFIAQRVLVIGLLQCNLRIMEQCEVIDYQTCLKSFDSFEWNFYLQFSAIYNAFFLGLNDYRKFRKCSSRRNGYVSHIFDKEEEWISTSLVL